MEISTNSISKGVFVFKNGPSIKQLKRKFKESQPTEDWYESFRNLWKIIQQKIEAIQSESYEKTLDSLLSFIQNADIADPNLQTAVLLTGVNQTDHFKQFDSLSRQIYNNCPSLVTILKSRDCPNVKSSVESLVGGLIYKQKIEKLENEEEEENIHIKLKKKQLSMPVLEAWYNSTYKDTETKPKLVILLADFEQFNPQVLTQFINVLCSYISRLPIVLILGVATVFKALHDVLPFQTTCKMSANLFRADSSTSILNRILDEVILTHHCPFALSGKSFKILMDIFLFYDYSIHSFIQGFKVFMLEHYMTNFFASIYFTQGTVYKEKYDQITSENIDYIKSLPSIKKFVEEKGPLPNLGDSEERRKFIDGRVRRVYRYFYQFFCSLRILAALIEDLPRNSLGKLHRELYPICAASEITKLEEFQECLKLLRFTSKDKILLKIDKIIEIIESFLEDPHVTDKLKDNLKKYLSNVLEHKEKLANAGMSPVKQSVNTTSPPKVSAEINKKGVMGRREMLEKLKESAKKNPGRVVIEYEQYLCDFIDFLNSSFENNLRPFSRGPALIELFVFSDCNSVRRQIVGAPRGSLHNALTNPHHYLQCKCCEMKEGQQLLPTLPDIAIAYKLHLECNKFINLYDWMQAFATVIDNHENESDDISPEIQARFTRATADLQFLGYIKPAKQKTDHVMRLTW